MKPKDQIALVIAVGLITWGILTIIGAIWRNKSLSEGGAEFFVAIGGAMAAMLVAYFTSNHNNNKKE